MQILAKDDYVVVVSIYGDCRFGTKLIFMNKTVTYLKIDNVIYIADLQRVLDKE